MKKLILLPGLALLVFASSQGRAQDTGNYSWRKSDDHWARKNSITLTTSAFGMTAYNGVAFPVFNLEYDRIIYRNVSVGAMGFYAKVRGGWTTDTYTMEENFFFAGAKVNYNLPIVRNLLYFRTGIGVGVGVHEPTDYNMGWTTTPPPSGLESCVKMHGIVDMYLVFRATRWLEFRVSPLLLSPSQFIFGSKFDAPYYNTTYFYWNPLGTLGLSVRF